MSDVHLTEIKVRHANEHGFPTYEIDLNGIELDEDIEIHIRNVLREARSQGQLFVNLYIKRASTVTN